MNLYFWRENFTHIDFLFEFFWPITAIYQCLILIRKTKVLAHTCPSIKITSCHKSFLFEKFKIIIIIL